MKRYLGAVAAAMLAMAPISAAPAFAHHSFAMFDLDSEATIEGVVKEFQFTNPHMWLNVTVKNAAGKEVVWSLEGGSPNALTRRGWKRTTFKPGDKIKVVLHPLKSGEPGGAFVRATFPDGTVIGTPAAEVAPADR